MRFYLSIPIDKIRKSVDMIFGLCYMFHKCRDEGGVVMQKKYLAVKEYLLEQINSGAYQPDEPRMSP